MNEQEKEYVAALESEYTKLASAPSYQQQSNSAATMFGAAQKQNLVEWQLDFRPELEDIQHLLRSDIIKKDDKTHREYWDTNPDKSSITFNEQGVNDILREIRMLLNKNKVLSNYSRDEVRERVRSIGHELRSFIYNNSEKYEIDNEYKWNNFPIIVLTILDMVEAGFRRAINGEERRGLGEARIVNQTEPLNYGYPQGQSQGGFQNNQSRKGKWYKPWTW